jgi:hypothetical protein
MISGWDSSGRANATQEWLIDPLFQTPPSGTGISKAEFFTTAGFSVIDYTGGIPRDDRCSW